MMPWTSRGVGPSELLRVDTLNLMAELSVAEKDLEGAKQFAKSAHQASIGVYHQGEARSRELLSLLGIEVTAQDEMPTQVASRDAVRLLDAIMKRVGSAGED
jgi:hypothetical protein